MPRRPEIQKSETEILDEIIQRLRDKREKEWRAAKELKQFYEIQLRWHAFFKEHPDLRPHSF